MSGRVKVERPHVTRWRLPLDAEDYVPWRKGFDSRFWPIGDLPAFLEWPVPSSLDAKDLARAAEWAIWQQGRCAICGNVSRGRSMHLDHDHDTGLIRGLLCPPCNRNEGTSSLAVFQLWRSGMNPCRMFGWDYLWQGQHRMKPLSPGEVLSLTRRALALEQMKEAQMQTSVRFLDVVLAEALRGGGNDSPK